MSKNDEGPIIGIYLGTKFSCVGIMRNGRVDIVPEANTRKNINYILGKNNDNKTFDELESIIKGNVVNENDKQKFDLFTFKAFWRINHEGFGHRPVSILNKKKYLLLLNFL